MPRWGMTVLESLRGGSFGCAVRSSGWICGGWRRCNDGEGLEGEEFGGGLVCRPRGLRRRGELVGTAVSCLCSVGVFSDAKEVEPSDRTEVMDGLISGVVIGAGCVEVLDGYEMKFNFSAGGCGRASTRP